MSSGYLLDASALLALIRAEPGSEKVWELLDASSIHAANLAEVMRKLIEKGMPIAEAESHLRDLKLPVIGELCEEQAYELGRLTAQARKLGLSLGDCICLTTAERHNLVPVTADRQWSLVDGIGPRAIQIR